MRLLHQLIFARRLGALAVQHGAFAIWTGQLSIQEDQSASLSGGGAKSIGEDQPIEHRAQRATLLCIGQDLPAASLVHWRRHESLVQGNVVRVAPRLFCNGACYRYSGRGTQGQQGLSSFHLPLLAGSGKPHDSAGSLRACDVRAYTQGGRRAAAPAAARRRSWIGECSRPLRHTLFAPIASRLGRSIIRTSSVPPAPHCDRAAGTGTSRTRYGRRLFR